MLTVWKTKALMRNRRLIIYSTDGLSTIKTGYKYNNFSYIIVTFFNVKNENMKQLIEVRKNKWVHK